MLNFFSGPDTGFLTQQFLDQLTYPEDPFKPAWVIAQNRETHEWLNLKVAEREGISAQIKFILPTEFIWKLYRSKNQNLPDELPSDRNAMTWAVFELLSKDEVSIPYMKSGRMDQKKILHLSEQISDVFDLYQNYRPQMMENWLSGTDFPDEHSWQADVWNALVRKWESDPKWRLQPRRSEAFNSIKEWCKEGLLRNVLPDKITVFGLSHMSGPFMDLLCSLSEVIDVDLFVSELHIAEDSEWNPILAAFSAAREAESEYLLGKVVDQSVPAEIHRPETVGKVVDVIEIHACHNPEREAEVLKDRLLQALEKDPGMGPEDVLIMVPDPDLYGQIVHSIFSDSERGPSIPVSDLSLNGGRKVAESLLMILDLLKSDFKSSKLSSFFMDPNIQQRFGLNEDDLFKLEQWVRDNNILFGMGKDVNQSGSWKKGLSRIMLGGLMHFDDREDYQGLIPYGGVELSEPLIIALSKSIGLIDHFNRLAEKENNVIGWLSYCSEIIKELISGESDADADSYSEFRLIDKMRRQASYHDPETRISFETFRQWFRKQLQGFKARSGRFGQGVTLSTYIPYRSLPFKWIAMMGLNEGSFPLKEIRPEFDLIHNDPLPGDRVQKADDTLLFAETLLAAGQTLFISYEGKDQKNDRDKLPSVLIQRLMDEMETGEDLIHVSHPLHPFSRTYFQGGQPLSYDAHASKINRSINSDVVVQPFLNTPKLPVTPEALPVQLNDLLRFFRDPAAYYMKELLGIDHFERNAEFREREVFDLSGLEKYQVDQLLFSLRSEGYNETEVEQYLIKADAVANGAYTRLQLRDEWTVIDDLYREIRNISSEDEEKREVGIEDGSYELNGIVGGVFGNRLMSFRVGKTRAVSLLEHWLSFSALCACYEDIHEAIFIAKDGDKVEMTRHTRPDSPEKYMKMLLAWYCGMQYDRDLNFFPESSLAYASQMMKSNDHEDAFKKGESEFMGSDYKRGESVRFHTRTLWKGREPLKEDGFREKAQKFWNPYLRAISEE